MSLKFGKQMTFIFGKKKGFLRLPKINLRNGGTAMEEDFEFNLVFLYSRCT